MWNIREADQWTEQQWREFALTGWHPTMEKGWKHDPSAPQDKAERFEYFLRPRIEQMKQWVFVDTPAREAENIRLRAEGVIAEGCDPNDAPPEGFDVAAHAKAAVARWKAAQEAAHAAGAHFVGCGHRQGDSGTVYFKRG